MKLRSPYVYAILVSSALLGGLLMGGGLQWVLLRKTTLLAQHIEDRYRAHWKADFSAVFQHADQVVHQLQREIQLNHQLLPLFQSLRLDQTAEAQLSLEQQLRQKTEPLWHHHQQQGIQQIAFYSPDSQEWLSWGRTTTKWQPTQHRRRSVYLANQSTETIHGFETDLTQSGFRYVWPVFAANQHVGTVSATFPCASMAQFLQQQAPSRNYRFALLRQGLETAIQPAYQSNQQPCEFSDALVYEPHSPQNPGLLSDLSPTYREETLEELGARIEARLGETGYQLDVLRSTDEHWILHSQAISDLQGNPSVILLALEPSPDLAHLAAEHQRLSKFAWAFSFIAMAALSALAGLGLRAWNRKQANLEIYEEMVKLVSGALYQLCYAPDKDKYWLSYASRGLIRLFEVEPEEARQNVEPLLQRVHPEDLPRLMQAIRTSARELKPIHARFRVCLSIGDPEWRDCRANPKRQSDGTILRYGLVTDITEQHQLALEVNQQRQIIEFILEETLSGYWDWDFKRNLEYLSPGFKRMFGYADHEPPNVPDSWMKLIYPESMHASEQALARHIASQGSIPYREELRYRHKDGSTVSVLCTGKVIEWDAQGNPVRMVGCHVDITRLKEVEAQLKQTNRDLEIVSERANAMAEQANLSNAAKSQFLAYVSHEIRTPLGGMLGMLQLILETPLDDEQLMFAQSSCNSAKSLLNLLNDILDFTKIEAGKLDLENVAFDLLEVLEEVCLTQSWMAQRKELEFICDLAPDVPRYLTGDPTRLRQIILNLCSNAIKFTEEGEVRIAVTLLSLQPDSCQLCFAVHDTGIGIPADKAEHLFQQYSQVSACTSRRFGGTGLGLAISRQLTELMGGQIALQSTEHVGSTFSVTLPFACDPQRLILAPQNDLQEQKLLFITQRPALQQCLSAWARQLGMIVTCLESKELAKPLLEKDTHAFLLLDPAPHETDTAPWLIELRQALQPCPTRILMLPYITPPQELEHYRKAADHILRKPALPHALASILKPTKKTSTMAPVPNNPAPESHSLTSPPTAKGPLNGLHVLVAEDNSTNQKVINMLLTKQSALVTFAETGREVIERLEQHAFDVILMDLRMPEMDGVTATRRIRQSNLPQSGIPIIALTAGAEEGDEDSCREAGMQGYLHKPVRREELIQTILSCTRSNADNNS